MVHLECLRSKCSDDRGIDRYAKVLQCFGDVGINRSSGDSLRLQGVLTIANHGPVIGCEDHRFVRGLEVGLVKAGEDDVTVVRLKFSVNVLTIIFILEVLEALAVADVERLKLDFDLVHTNLLVLDRDVDAMVLPQVLGLLAHVSSIDNDRSDQLAFEVNEETLFVVAVGDVCGRYL